MDIMEEVVIQKVEQLTSADAEPSEWKVRPLADWVNLNFPLGMPEAEIIKAAESGKERPCPARLFDGLERGAIRRLQFHLRKQSARPTN